MFLELELGTQEGEGGYAREQSEAFLNRQQSPLLYTTLGMVSPLAYNLAVILLQTVSKKSSQQPAREGGSGGR